MAESWKEITADCDVKEDGQIAHGEALVLGDHAVYRVRKVALTLDVPRYWAFVVEQKVEEV